MKWIYLLLGIAAAIFAVLTAVFEEPNERAEGLRICITAAVVNLGLFSAISWAQRRRASQSEAAQPEQDAH